MTLFRNSESWLRAAPQSPYVGLLTALAIAMPTSSIYAQGTVAVSVVNMIPQTLSGESVTDSEPNLAVNPSNTQNIAASAFTPDPMGGVNAPIYISTDGGQSWVLNSIVPGNDTIAETGTHDITLRFGSTSNVLYAAIQRGDATNVLSVLRTNDFTSANPMTELVSRGGVDQPYVEAISVAGTDRVYVGYSDLTAPGGMRSTVERSLDAATTPAPAGFTSQRIEARNTCGNEAPSVRPAVHETGTVYAAFFRWTKCDYVPYTSDVVVVRDDNFAAGSSGAFTALREPPPPAGDGMPGVSVVTDRLVPFGVRTLGYQKVGSRISIAVDPYDSQRVYLAWGDGADAAHFALHVRKSSDGGVTWSSNDLRTIPSATNPSLAINSRGRVGFLYQKLTGTAPGQRWETHLERTDDDFATPPIDLVLHQAPDTVGHDPLRNDVPLGDYNQLLAVGRDFYGVFSGNNTPDMANFPHGVKFQRNADFAARKLLAVDNVTEVNASIDPFFFKVPEVLIVDTCLRHPWLCVSPSKLGRGSFTLECALRGCIIVDPLPKNCLVKFSCPGCGPGGLCPPFYNIYLDGLKQAWDVGLYDAKGRPVEHKQFNTRAGLVISFRPSRENYLEGRIGNYLLGFEMSSKGTPGTEYKVKTRVQRSDRPFEPPN